MYCEFLFVVHTEARVSALISVVLSECHLYTEGR